MSSELEKDESVEACRDFANGICKRRSNCKFRHLKPENGEENEGGDDDASICRDYLRNSCNRGNCKFRHPKATEKQKLARRTAYTFCHDFSNGICRRRDCRYLHATKEEEEYFNDTGTLPPHLRAQVAVGFGSTDASIVEGDKPVCRDFLVGKCERGPRCKFEHRGNTRGGGPLRERFGRYYMESASFLSDDPYDTSYPPPYKRRALDEFGEGYYRRSDMILEEENNMLRRKVEELKKQVSELTAANDVLLEQNARLRVSKVNSITAMTVTTPSAVVSVTPAVTPIATPAVAVPAPQVNSAAAQLNALTASINQQVALNSEVVQHAMQAQLVQEVAMGAPHTSLAGPASIASLTPAMSMSQPALVSAPYARS